MITREEMKRWLGENTTLSESSVYKYAHAAEPISKDMLAKGVILSPTYDRLFDTGLISFENSGKVILSHLLTPADKEKLFLAPGSVYDIQANPELNHNLEYHRDVVFIK